MRRFTLFAPLALALALVAPAAALAQQQPAKLLPSGRTLGFLEVSDWQQAETTIKSTDLGQAWTALEPFYNNLKQGLDAQLAEQKGQFQEQFGVNADDVVAVLKGGFALALVDTAPEGGRPQPIPVAIFPSRAKPTIAALIETVKKKQGEGGPPLFVVDKPGACCVTLDQNALVMPAGAGALTDDAQYMATRAKVLGSGQPVFFLYYDVKGTLARFANDPQMQQDLDKAGLADVRAAGIGLSAEAGRIREGLAIMAPGEKKGIMKILAGAKPLDISKIADKMPGNLYSMSAIRLDLRALFDQVLDLARAFNPDVDKDVAQEDVRAPDLVVEFEKNFGMKLKEDVLEPLGDLVTAEAAVPDDALLPESVFAIDVRNAAKVQSTLQEIARRAGFEVATVERGGRKINHLQAPLGKLGQDPMAGMNQDQAGAQVIMTALFGAWTVDQGRLYFSSMPQALEERFEHMQKGSLSETEAWKTAVAKAPPGPRSFGWQKTRGFMGTVYQLGLLGLRALEPMARRAGVAMDTALLPRPSQFAAPFRPMTMSVVGDQDGLFVLSQGGFPILTTVPVVAGVAGFAYQRRQAEAGREMQSMQVEFDLRTLSYAESSWKMEKGAYTGSMDELIQAGQIDGDFAGRAMQAGYRYAIENADKDHFTIVARPTAPGKMALMVDESMEVRPYGASARRGPHRAEPGGDESMPPPPPEDGDMHGGKPQGPGGAMVGDDAAHKLYQAAAMTGDSAIVMEMYKKLGFMSADGMNMDNDKMQKFTSEHGAWAQKNVQFIVDIQSPEKARAYWDAHK